MTSTTIATNDMFKDLCLLMRIHKDKELVIGLFESQGWEVSKAKLKAWSVRTGGYNKDFRAMPEKALRDFIQALHEAKLIEENTYEL